MLNSLYDGLCEDEVELSAIPGIVSRLAFATDVPLPPFELQLIPLGNAGA